MCVTVTSTGACFFYIPILFPHHKSIRVFDCVECHLHCLKSNDGRTRVSFLKIHFALHSFLPIRKLECGRRGYNIKSLPRSPVIIKDRTYPSCSVEKKQMNLHFSFHKMLFILFLFLIHGGIAAKRFVMKRNEIVGEEEKLVSIKKRLFPSPNRLDYCKFKNMSTILF